MDVRRTRRNVLSTTAGLGLALVAGCLDDIAASGLDDGAGERPTYREWLLAASVSNDLDLSELTISKFDLAAIDAVSDSLPSETERGLTEAAYGNVYGIDDTIGRENVDATFSFGPLRRDGESGAVHCHGFEGTFDAPSIREEIEAEGDADHRTAAGFDVYASPGSTLVASSESVVAIDGEIDAVSLLERLESADYESGDDSDRGRDDFETLVGQLDGAVVVGDFRSSVNGDGESGYGGSIEFDEQQTTTRLVFLYDDAPDDETVEDVETSVGETEWFGGYDDTSVVVDGRAIVITGQVETERFSSAPW